MGKANLYALFFGIPLVGILILPYFLVYGFESTNQIRLFFAFKTFIPAIVIGIVIHEAIHGFTWSIAARIPISDIKFGFQIKTITPYAHCKVPIKMFAYRLGAIMPFLLLGIVPYGYALATQNPIVLGFSLFFSFVAIGDLMILWISKDIPADKKVFDHPTEGGVTTVD